MLRSGALPVNGARRYEPRTNHVCAVAMGLRASSVYDFATHHTANAVSKGTADWIAHYEDAARLTFAAGKYLRWAFGAAKAIDAQAEARCREALTPLRSTGT